MVAYDDDTGREAIDLTMETTGSPACGLFVRLSGACYSAGQTVTKGNVMKILCAADLHLGRRASRLPRGVSVGGMSATAGWQDIVQLALDQEVALVLLAGDVVDWENRYYEAYGPLERGVRRLVDAGVAVWAVAGNHDVEALPRLTDAMKGSAFRLLGRSGEWERAVFEEDGRPVLAVDGWSFRQRVEKVPPLTSYSLPAPDGVPRLVMLHGDLDQSGSVYAPISRTDMQRVGAEFWLLGHIHKPMLDHLPGGAPVLYPGSPMALDPGETGPHGPWLLEVDHGLLSEPRQVALSRMRYENITMDLSGITELEEFDVRVLPSLRQEAGRILADHLAARSLSLRVTLTGRTCLHGRLSGRVTKLVEDFETDVDGVPIGIDKVDLRTVPDRALDEIARGTSPAALLARLLQDLDADHDGPHEEVAALLDLAGRKLNAAAAARPFQFVTDEQMRVEVEETRLRLRRAGLDLLERLLGQIEAS